MSRFDVEGYKKLAKTIKENEIENARHKRMLKDIEEGRYSINLASPTEVFALLELLRHTDRSVFNFDECLELHKRLIHETETILEDYDIKLNVDGGGVHRM